MLGNLLNKLKQDAGFGIERLYSDDLHRCVHGTAIIAIENPDMLASTGLPTGIQYGILSDNGHVICQLCTHEDFDSAEFKVCEVPLAQFCAESRQLFLHPNQSENTKRAYRKAKREIGTTYRNLRSYPGDDFVAEIISGDSRFSLSLCRTDKQTGQHWWTPLYYTLEELRELAEEATSIKVPFGKSPINPELLHLRHHGITIESNWVIHFSNCRVPDKSNQVKFDTLDSFCAITPTAEEKGGALNYPTDDEYKRLLHRNRAVWILFHAQDWGKYNLITNNCEHFCRMCKVGRKQSAQVKKGAFSVVSNIVLPLIPGGVVTKALASIGIPYLLNEVLNHRIIKDSAPPLPFE